MTQFSVTKNGKKLSKKLYFWDESTKTFSSNENNLVLDFSNISGVTFNTGYNCTFKTGSDCSFNTGSDCCFKTGNNCCFKTGYNCTFDTEDYCTFNTGSDCTFKTKSSCTFDTGDNCCFTTGEQCVVVRRDVYEIYELIKGIKYVLNEYRIPGLKNKEEIFEGLL